MPNIAGMSVKTLIKEFEKNKKDNGIFKVIGVPSKRKYNDNLTIHNANIIKMDVGKTSNTGVSTENTKSGAFRLMRKKKEKYGGTVVNVATAKESGSEMKVKIISSPEAVARHMNLVSVGAGLYVNFADIEKIENLD